MNTTNITMMPVVVSGRSNGEISAAILSSAVGGGWRTSTGNVVHELSRQTREDAMAAFAKSWRRA
jgi:hypothetical protein